MNAAANVDEYLAGFTGEIRQKLDQLRALIRSAAPDAEEGIGYGMPAYKMNGILVYFAGTKSHIGFYPTGSGVAQFQHDLTGYSVSKGTIRFPIAQPLPVELIKRIVRFRLEENREKATLKRSLKKAKGPGLSL
jgi:uncharacterized protein YdhG (YjbR/CyaY superfamily)